MELTPQSGPKIVAILNEGFGPPVISIYECGAAQRQAIRGHGAEAASCGTGNGTCPALEVCACLDNRRPCQ
jgi:hypothetical protein